jgi:hypothetical protein
VLKKKTIRNGRRRLLKFTFRCILKEMFSKSSVRICRTHNKYKRFLQYFQCSMFFTGWLSEDTYPVSSKERAAWHARM